MALTGRAIDLAEMSVHNKLSMTKKTLMSNQLNHTILIIAQVYTSKSTMWPMTKQMKSCSGTSD